MRGRRPGDTCVSRAGELSSPGVITLTILTYVYTLTYQCAEQGINHHALGGLSTITSTSTHLDCSTKLQPYSVNTNFGEGKAPKGYNNSLFERLNKVHFGDGLVCLLAALAMGIHPPLCAGCCGCIWGGRAVVNLQLKGTTTWC